MSLANGPHFLSARTLARVSTVFFETLPSVPRALKSHGRTSILCPWSFLPPLRPLPLPLRAPHSLPLALQTPQNYVTHAHCDVFLS